MYKALEWKGSGVVEVAKQIFSVTRLRGKKKKKGKNPSLEIAERRCELYG